MRKFTNAWLWMMIFIISSQINLLAQKFSPSDKAPGKIDNNEELLKQLSGIKFSEEQIIVLEKYGIDIKSIIDDEVLLKAAEVLGLATKTNSENFAGNSYGLFLPGKTDPSKAILDFPWIEGFEDVTIPALPTDWLEENGDWVTTNNANSTYDADAHTGTQFLRESYYATNEYVWTPGFALDAGTHYDLSFWWAGDNFSGWTGDIFYNTTQNSAGATQLGNSFVEAGTTTTKNYAQVLYTFLPTSTSTYYFAIRVNCPSYTPWYLSFDDFRLDLSPECPQPNTLGTINITATTADLTWISFSGLSDIEIGPYGFTPTGIPTYNAIISPFNIGGLSPSTWYSFYVRDDCGGGLYSNWAGPYSFSTTQILATLPYFIDFESGNMNDWTLLNGTQVNSWYVGTATAYPGSSYSVYISNDNGISNNYTIGTSSVVHFYRDIEFPNVPNPINLTFDWKCFGESTYDFLKVFLIEPNIIPVPGSQLTNGLIGNTYYNLQSDWQSASIQLDPGVNGTIKRLVFSWRNDASVGTPPPAAVDNINLYVITCPQPIDLGATYIAATSADLTWSSYSGLSDIEFGLEGFTPTGVPTYAGVVSPYSVTGLTAVTGYSFYVRDDCGGGDYSPWSGPYTFTTQPTCPQPFDLSATNITMTTADLLWISFSGLSDIEFGPSGFTPSGIPTYAGVISPYNLSGLNSASPYDFYVRDDCGGGDYSFWSGPYTFLTMPGSQTMPVFEDFENGFVYFNNASGNFADWTINNTYYHSGGQCGHNIYGNDQTNILHETGIIDLSAAEVVWLDFWQIAKTEGNYDHCIVEISTDGGLNYTTLPIESYTGSGNYYVPTANPPYEICFDEDSYAIWGTGTEIPDNSTWWQHETFDLSNYLTTNVRIRFRLHTDVSLIRYGWLIDEILIFEPAYGTLTGTVTEAASNNPIEGATINIGSLTTTSAVDGTYNFPAVLTGTWIGTCSKTGFNPANTTVTILEDQTTTQDFPLTTPQIVLNTTSIAVEIEPNATANETLNISNPGNGPLEWNAIVTDTTATWITINPVLGTLLPASNQDINLHFDAMEMLPGVYLAEIHFSTNPDVGSPVVNVTMTVAGLIPAVDLTAGYSCTDVELTWEMPIGGNPDSWNVYKDGTLLGNVTSMEHTDLLVTTGVEISYYVTAVYAGEESMPSTPATITVPIPGSLQPIGLSAEANTPNYGYVTLEWNQPNACLDPDGYDLYRDNVKVNTALVTELTYIEGPLPSGLYEYKLKAVYYFGESGFSTPAYAFIPVGIEDAEESNFRIYPNPASQHINIESGTEITGIKILNNSGQKLFDETLNVFNYQIDVSRFEKGIYFIGIKTKDNEVYKKITID
jgi:hypothetical protein